MKQQTHFHAQMWNQKGAKHAKLEQIMLYIELCGHGLVFDDSVSKFVGVQEDLPGKRQQQNPPKKRVRHRYAKPESAKKNEAPQPAQPSTPSIARLNQLPPMRSINLDVSKFAQPYGDNFVFKGLVAEFPGWDPEGVVDVVLDDEVQYDKMQVVEAGVDEMEVDGEEDEDIAGLPMDFSRLTIVELMRGLEDDVEMGDA